MKILMVCLGNICRSPLAEGILQQKAAAAGLHWQVDSAGTNGYHTGQAPHRLSQKVARHNGLDISRQRARQFTSADIPEYDLVYALATDVLDEMKRIHHAAFPPGKVALLLEELYPGKNADVPDPYYGEEDGYHDVYELISKACDAIISRYRTAGAS
ncbi:MAG: low molecular weight phosphotyrosine protein phosphatase [Candidatus Pseudobacter hemicellulosilyticus]|uniref:protein-tyrosine-phosphatase n=1 Tax=Candidatus Pseudobacter hemicellulosilyticus TaxID=3121375 RepID=A0AAJ6BGH4_9BACT|nr:MAG: low molecular weight phosphotyrosine protein phosphatase [Pseudobacter sp.]